ncbi:citrate lyase subunit beta [Paenibacillus terrae]|uniref:Citrate lyase subunit beta n=1 Tax=Paenibacillus terrae TaxID=159743 RepID=A0A0D7WXA8_9BACL|nr:citrate lyase subunit beta [Paenibacillus terrae]
MEPEEFENHSPKEVLAYGVGAALYMPATRPFVVNDLCSQKHKGLQSIVLDLEDAIGDQQVIKAEETLCLTLTQIARHLNEGLLSTLQLPLFFIRVRNPEQLKRVIEKIAGEVILITGFILPKFNVLEGVKYFEILRLYNKSKPISHPTLYGLPILETADVLYKETRLDALINIKNVLDKNKDLVLNIRIGATDFSSRFGLRRSPDMTIYDISIIRDCMSDIINLFGRAVDNYVISGPVWEYFSSTVRVFNSQLKDSSFEETMINPGKRPKLQMISRYEDGLIREVLLDKENGIIGKTIIHPTHIDLVQSLYTVTREEYVDANSIIHHNNGLHGVVRSEFRNKMNEIKPHLNWAYKILIRAKVYGVLNDNMDFTSLLDDQARCLIQV